MIIYDIIIPVGTNILYFPTHITYDLIEIKVII